LEIGIALGDEAVYWRAWLKRSYCQFCRAADRGVWLAQPQRGATQQSTLSGPEL